MEPGGEASGAAPVGWSVRRAGEILERNEEYHGYGVVFRDAVNRRFEQTTSIAVDLLATAAFAALLWHRWLT